MTVFNLVHRTGLVLVALTLAVAFFCCLVLIKSTCVEEDPAGASILTFISLTSTSYLPETNRRTAESVNTFRNCFS